MNNAKLTSALLLLSSTLLVTACSSHNPKPDTAYTLQTTTEENYSKDNTYTDNGYADDVYAEEAQDDSMASVDPMIEPMIEPEDDTPVASLPDIPPEMVIDSQDPLPEEDELAATDDTIDNSIEDTRPAKTLFLFGFDQKQLDDEAETLLREHGRFLASHPDMKININGHADPQGDPNYNQYLAQQRAEYVAELLEQEGVSLDQIQVQSWGADKPVPSATHNRENRRVELIYDGEYLVNYQSE